MSASPPPARVHILLAREAPVGLVIRRGPTKRVATLLWDRERDEFTLGQWLKGRIYERRSDLSPDGRYWIYFAMNGDWAGESRGSWTAVAPAPWLKAIAFYPKGDCWNGGGLWTTDRTYWVNDPPECSAPLGDALDAVRESTEVARDEKHEVDQRFGNECLSVYLPRLLRDGWRRGVDRTRPFDTLEKPLPHGWILRKFLHAGPPGVRHGCYWDEHAIVHEPSSRLTSKRDWEWAEVDRDRVVWCADGRLYAGSITPDGLADERELHDFNPLEFEAIPAPY
ncbi:MAG: hypothetical protein ACF8PN_04810 [Phycisphaerales bacterium]